MLARRMRLLVFLFLTVSTLVLSACNLMIQPTPTVTTVGKSTQVAIYTAAAETIEAQLTQAARQSQAGTATPIPATEMILSPTPSATATQVSIMTATPKPPTALPATPTATPTEIVTPTPEVVLISATINTNCRSGPGPQYKLVGYLVKGQQSEVLARNQSGSWWYIRNPSHPDRDCWVWAQTTNVSGDNSKIPFYSSLAVQTPVSTSGLAFKIESVNLTFCGGMPAAVFGVENSGSVRFESASLTLEDLTSGVTLLQSSASNSPFRTAIRGCPIGESSLASGGSRFIGGPLAQAARHAHNGRVTIQLCTQDGLGGECVQRNAEFVIP